jgi:DNA primase
MAAMIPDEKKEEIRDRADLVEVVDDYVKLKRSGRSWKGLCPFHDENTASFNVTPELGIYKCFGCGASGDVFNFMMEMEGVGFVEAMRTLADRFGVTLPEEEEEEYSEAQTLREGIYHALKYAGVYYHSQLNETDEAKKARQYLQNRGYNRPINRKYGLGYAPQQGDALYRAATDSGLNEEYLLEAGLIKPSQREDGFYDAFRGRLMFPIFNTTGKVIAFAGRVLGNEKTAKYINSPQTKVYNKSEVLYGINFAKNEIRKNDEVILVEGYTDVISLQQHDINNVVASSGTSLTPGQLKLLHRYGETITMIYDSDAAGQAAMKRGINLALDEGMDVKLLELPEGDDPDSFIRQFGKDSFLDLKKEKGEDFVSYLIHKAQNEGRWDDPSKKNRAISEALESIAHIPDKVARETFLQHLNSLTKIGDRELHEELGKILQEVKQQKERAQRRKKRREERQSRKESPRQATQNQGRPDHHTQAFDAQMGSSENRNRRPAPPKDRPGYEKELIRLMLNNGSEMINYIGSNCNENQFSDKLLRDFYHNIIERHKNDEKISVEFYSNQEHPYPELVGEIMIDQYGVSERHAEKTGARVGRDNKPYRTAKSSLKSLIYAFIVRKIDELTDALMDDDLSKRDEVRKIKTELQREKTRFERYSANEIFDDPDGEEAKNSLQPKFEYKMKGEE